MAGADAASLESPEELSFEAALARLEQVVDRLEGGDLELEAALASFEEGVRLTRHCAEHLDAAERRIEVLLEEGAALVTRPFDDDTNGDPSAGVEGKGDARGDHGPKEGD